MACRQAVPHSLIRSSGRRAEGHASVAYMKAQAEGQAGMLERPPHALPLCVKVRIQMSNICLMYACLGRHTAGVQGMGRVFFKM